MSPTLVPCRHPVSRAAAALAGLVLLATACADSGPRPQPPGTAGRRALAILAEDGAVLVEVNGQPALVSAGEVGPFTTSEIARAVPGMDVTFTTDPAGAVAVEPHLVVIYDPAPSTPGEAACGTPGSLSLAPAPDRVVVLAAFCDGAEVIGLVREQAEVGSRRDVQRLLWRVAQRLFPDDYDSTYGINVLPPGLGVGLGGSVGF